MCLPWLLSDSDDSFSQLRDKVQSQSILDTTSLDCDWYEVLCTFPFFLLPLCQLQLLLWSTFHQCRSLRMSGIVTSHTSGLPLVQRCIIRSLGIRPQQSHWLLDCRLLRLLDRCQDDVVYLGVSDLSPRTSARQAMYTLRVHNQAAHTAMLLARSVSKTEPTAIRIASSVMSGT